MNSEVTVNTLLSGVAVGTKIGFTKVRNRTDSILKARVTYRQIRDLRRMVPVEVVPDAYEGHRPGQTFLLDLRKADFARKLQSR